MISELTVNMLPCRYKAFSEVLYGDEYGFRERTLTLQMMPGQDNLNVKLPMLCRYKFNLPILSTRIDKDI
jgi:hypothetical protein